MFKEYSLNLPTEHPLLSRRNVCRVADDTFPLQLNILKPYSGFKLKGSRP